MLARLQSNCYFILCWWGCKMAQSLCRTDWQFPMKSNIMWLSNPTSRYSAKRYENLDPQKNLYINTYSSSIHNHRKLTTPPKPFDRWVDKETVVNSYNRMLLKNKNNNKLLIIYTTTWMNLEGIILSKRSRLQKVTFVWFHLHTFSKRQNYSDRDIGGCHG